MSKFFGPSRLQAFALCLCIWFEILPMSRSLLCYSCLRMDCKADDQLCTDIRRFIVDQLRSFYYIDSDLPPCPPIEDVVAWKLMQVGAESCRYRRAEEATCALSRLQIIAEASEDERVTTYATAMGCASYELLKIVKDNKITSYCPLFAYNTTDRATHLKFSYELETCNVIGEYCMDQDFCVSHTHSEVRPFKKQTKDQSFDLGFIIGIIVVTVVVMAAFILASVCRTPMSWSSNTYHFSDDCSSMITNNCNARRPNVDDDDDTSLLF